MSDSTPAFTGLLAFIGGIALLMGCSVDPDVRCNFGQIPCPEAFYCGGEWCYPTGTGPGTPDMATTPDMAQADMARPDMAPADMMLPVDMAPADMMLPVDMAVPDMRVPGPDMRVPAPDMRVPDPDMRVPAPDMRVPDPDMQVPDPDMRVPDPDMDPPNPDMDPPDPDMRVPDPDMDPPDPDMDPPAPQIMLDTYLPGDGVLSTAPDRQQLTIALTLGDFNDEYPLLVGFLPVVNGELFDAERCRAIADRESPVQFLRGQGTLTIPLADLREQPNNPAHVCIVDPAPDGAIIHFEARFDVDPPVLRVDQFETNPDRTSGVLPVAILSDDVDRADVAIFGEDCTDDPFEGQVGPPGDDDGAGGVVFPLSGLQLGRAYPASIRAVDAAGNETCERTIIAVDGPPSVANSAVFCARGNDPVVRLDVSDDGQEAPTISIIEADTTCAEYEEVDDDGVLIGVQPECTDDCVMVFEVRDAVGPIAATVAINVYDPNAPPFHTPFALSYRVDEALGTNTPSGAVRTRRGNIDTVIVSGRSGNGSRMMQWRQGQDGWFGTSGLNLAGVPVAGTFMGVPGPQTFIGNVGLGVNDTLSSEGCGVVLVGPAPFSLSAGPVLAVRACSVQAGNFIANVQSADLDDDGFDDVVGRDSLGRVDLWRGAVGILGPAVNLYAEEEVRALDFAAIPGVERVVIALDSDGLERPAGALVVDMQGTATPLFVGEAVSCVAAVDWLGFGAPAVALCLPDRIEILIWDGAAFGSGAVVGEPFDTLPVPLDDAYLTDLLFERTDGHPFPSALWVDSLDRAGTLDQADLKIWDIPEPIRGIIDLDPTAVGFDAALLARNSSRIFWMLSDDAEGAFAHRPIGPGAGLPPTARFIGGADVTGDYVDDLVVMTVEGPPRLQAGEIVGGQWSGHVVTDVGVQTDHLGAIGDFNADGRRELAAVREFDNGTMVLRVSQAKNLGAGNIVLNDGVDLAINADGVRPWGLATGPMRDGTPVDLIAVGIGQDLRIYQADFAPPDEAVQPLGLALTIPNVLPGEIAIARYNGTPAVVVFRQGLNPSIVSHEAWSIGGVPLGGGRRDGTLGHVRTADLQGGRTAFVTIRNSQDNVDVLRLDGDALTVIYEAGDAENVDFAVGDLDGDQRADLVVAVQPRRDVATVRTLHRQANGALLEALDERYTAGADEILDAVFIGDFDGDRRPDRAAVMTTRAGRKVVLSGRVAD